MDKRTAQDKLYWLADEWRQKTLYYSLADDEQKMQYALGRAVGLEEAAGLIEELQDPPVPPSDEDLLRRGMES